MSEEVEEMIVRNLIEALNRLHEDLDRVELCMAALKGFQHPAPEYWSTDQFLLPTRKPEPR